MVQKISYGYDTNLWLDRLTVSGDSTRFYHNADGVLTAIKHMTHAGTKIDSIAYTISTVHQGVTATHSAAGLSSFNSAYSRDSLGRITQRSLADTMWNYAYDAHGQLTKYAALTASDSLLCVKDPHYMDGEHCTTVGSVDTLRSQTFTYDSVGNRTDNSPTIAAGNRLTAWLGYTLAYDSVGNLVHKSKTGFNQYLYWNSLGQLDSAKTNGVLVSFGYDGLGRRVRKTDSTVVLKYIYDGAQLATIDSANIQIQTFTYYPGSETPHSVQRNSGNRQYYVTEIVAGSVWGLTDSTAAIKNHYRYAPFGLLEDSSEVVKNPLRFTGREYDPETRLYFNRARYYDPELARFISEDPVGQNGGANEYSYTGNDPVNATDPSGTEPEENGYAGMQKIAADNGAIFSLGYAGGDIGWDAANGGIEDAWSHGGVIDPTTGGIVYSGSEAVGVLLGLPGVELVNGNFGTNASGSQPAPSCRSATFQGTAGEIIVRTWDNGNVAWVISMYDNLSAYGPWWISVFVNNKRVDIIHPEDQLGPPVAGFVPAEDAPSGSQFRIEAYHISVFGVPSNNVRNTCVVP